MLENKAQYTLSRCPKAIVHGEDNSGRARIARQTGAIRKQKSLPPRK